MNLTVCMIVKNEEEHIRACLESMPSEVEIIVVDTGSTDNTIAMIQLYENVHLYHYEWGDSFADARNFSLSLATGTHTFVLDADERFQRDTYNEILKHIDKNPKLPAAVMIRNIDDGNEETRVHRMVRLFPNDNRYSYRGSVHESLHKNQSPALFVMSDVEIDHYGYNQSNYREQKYKRYYSLYHHHLEANPTDGYMWYQLGRLHASVEECEDACEAFIQASSFMTKPTLAHGAMVVEFSKLLRKVQMYEEAIIMLEDNVNSYADYPDLWFQLGLLYMDVGQMKRIADAFGQALKIGETRKYATTQGVGSYLAAFNLGVFCEVTGDTDGASKYYRQATPYEPALNRLQSIIER